ncbi:uncharacterized protein DDB_G0283697 [Drosophila navojoa]|uniref:uncharacterized protein DDB_G0283697 n=1 Tax=Drosophila navojoa TaxID=7232 RepID=UPI00084709A9|nr:uncharacterized protein DDB_G0283697 [Drosophila navojoa]
MLDEELDIYDDLDQFQEAETKKCKELEAWEAKYNAARLEIESLQAEKKTLAKKIRTMEVNFQNLLDTAKAEIKRKDAQIIQLRKEKDDICFRRKQPPKSQIPPSSQIPELQQHQQSKRFKSDEMADRKTENAIAFNNQNENCDKKAKKHDNPEAKRHQVAQPIVRDGKERYKQERQEKQDMPLCSNPTTKVPWSVHIRSTHDRDREKQQERRRDRDHARGRSRRRSRSRSRSRSHSREHAKSRSQRQSSRSKDQRRKRSRSRSQYRSRSGSRSFNQTSSKNSKRNSSRETEKGPNAKCTAQSKRNKEDMMDTLFGSTPTQKSPSKDGKRCVDSQKVMENLLANVDPYTPIEQYTPQSQIEAKEEQQTHELIGKERQLLAEDINNYFERNVEKIKQISQKDIIINKQVPRQHTLVNVEQSKLETSAESKMSTVELVNETDNESNKNAREHAENEAKIKTSRQNESIAEIKVVIEKPNSEKGLDDIIVNDAFNHQRIPGLDFIAREQERESDANNAIDIRTGEQKRVFDTDNAVGNDHIPDLDLINGKKNLNEMDKAQASKLISLNSKEAEMMEVIDANEHNHASGSGLGDQANLTDANDAQDLNSEEVAVKNMYTKPHGISVEDGSSIAEAANAQPFIPDLNSPKIERVKKKKKKHGKTKLESGLERKLAEEVDTVNRAEPVANLVSHSDLKIEQDLDGVKGGSKLEDEEKRKSTSDRDASGETDFSKDEEMPDLILGVDELTNEATDNKITAENDDNQKIGNSFIAKLDVESEEADKQYCVTAEQLKSDANESFVTDKTEAIKTNTTNCDKDNNCEQAIDICHPERRQNMETTVNGSTMSQEPNPCQLAYARLAEENLKTPKRPGRSMESIQIIEDIRLPIKMDIENIADKVDGSNEKQTHTEDLNSNMREAAPTTSESEKSQLEIMAVNQNDSKSATVVTVNRPITPKLAVEAATVMYAQPDSTKIDHSEDDATLEAAMNELIPVKPQESYPNLSLEADTIEIALKQLHQAPCQSEDQPDETAVTSTSMKGGQTPKQDLIQILMQSPMQQTAEHSPIKPNKGIKQIVERTIRKRKSPSSENVESLTPDRREHTPLKKRTTDLRNEHIINSDDPSIPPTPPEVATTAKPSELNVTIDETCYASSLDQSQSLNSSDSLLVTKRCSLGNSDYQFERLNDEVVLRVTRRRRRRPAAEIAIIDDK